MSGEGIFFEFCLDIANFNNNYGAQYLLDGYATLGVPETLVKNGVRYTVQRFQGEHKNEFLLRSETDHMFLFENNVLKQHWQENGKGVKSDKFIAYKNGRVDFLQRFEDILNQRDSKRIVIHKKGFRMEIWSAKTGHLIYHGETNEKRQKEGWGIEYDEESGRVVIEGTWNKGTLIEVTRCFNEDIMTELKRNGKDSLDPVKRIPIYVGGFRYDEDTETFVREGKGCLIDERTGIATRECVWKDGREVSGVNLNDGWYTRSTNSDRKPVDDSEKEEIKVPPAPIKVRITEFAELSNLNLQVTDLTICSNCCNDLTELDLNRFEWLQSIEIGDECFGSVSTFKIDRLNQLKSLKIGKKSFTQRKNDCGDDKSKSFHILNCESLKSIEIGEYSFSDFGGQFELKNLPALLYIKFDSCNFRCSSFVIRGILNDIEYVMIRSS